MAVEPTLRELASRVRAETRGLGEAELRNRLLAECEETIDLILRKRRDYGIRNIAMTGLPGLAVRLLDKGARLWNLTTRADGPAVVDESTKDTLRDVVGYGLIGLVGDAWGIGEEES